MVPQKLKEVYLIVYGLGEFPSTQTIWTIEDFIEPSGKLAKRFVGNFVTCRAIHVVPVSFASQICDPSNRLGGSPCQSTRPPVFQPTSTLPSSPTWTAGVTR